MDKNEKLLRAIVGNDVFDAPVQHPETYQKPTITEMNKWLISHRAGFDSTDTKAMVFAIGGKIEIYTKDPGQDWKEAKLHAFGYKDHDMLNKYNSLP